MLDSQVTLFGTISRYSFDRPDGLRASASREFCVASRNRDDVLVGYCSAIQRLVSVPMPSISTLTVSLGFKNTGGFRATPTPGGVPV